MMNELAVSRVLIPLLGFLLGLYFGRHMEATACIGMTQQGDAQKSQLIAGDNSPLQHAECRCDPCPVCPRCPRQTVCEPCPVVAAAVSNNVVPPPSPTPLGVDPECHRRPEFFQDFLSVIQPLDMYGLQLDKVTKKFKLPAAVKVVYIDVGINGMSHAANKVLSNPEYFGIAMEADWRTYNRLIKAGTFTAAFRTGRFVFLPFAAANVKDGVLKFTSTDSGASGCNSIHRGKGGWDAATKAARVERARKYCSPREAWLSPNWSDPKVFTEKVNWLLGLAQDCVNSHVGTRVVDMNSPAMRLEDIANAVPDNLSIDVKIDAQGADIDVFESLGSAAHRVRSTSLEVQDLPVNSPDLLYETQPNKEQIIERMRKMGFVLDGTCVVNNCAIAEYDCDFKRA